MKKFTLAFTLICFKLFLSAQTIALDSTFGVNGNVNTMMYDPDGNPYGANLVLLPNGEIVVIGLSIDSSQLLSTLQKYGPNGALDQNFTHTFPELWSRSTGVALQMDGKLLVTGSEDITRYHGAVFRLNVDGKRDSTFGVNGFASIYTDAVDNIIPMELSTGKIIVYGDAYNPSVPSEVGSFATRLHPNGTVDQTFGDTGYFRYNLPDKILFIEDVLELPDGKLIFAGMASWDLYLFKLDQNGNLDLSFGTNGHVIDPMPTGSEAYSLAVQPDGKIVVCGYAFPSYNPIVARYNENGSRDTSFGDQGVIFFSDIEIYSEGIGIEVLPNGKILVGISNFSAHNFYMAQLLPSGARDTTFGVQGIYTYEHDDFRARAMHLNGNIVAVSGREQSPPFDHLVHLIRLILDLNVGTLDPNAPSEPALLIYPNPIASQFSIKFDLVQQETVSIELYDLQGKLVQSFVQNQFFEQGEYALELNCVPSLSAGNYVLTLQVGGRKMRSIQVMKN